MDLKDIFKNPEIGKNYEINGWIKNHRKQKDFGFIDFYDGTCFKSLQVVYDNTLENFDSISKLLVGCAINVKGVLVESQGNQDFELKASDVTLLGNCDETYPIQPKRHTREFLR